MRLTPFSISLPLAVSALVLATAATAQTGPGGYPARPIKMVFRPLRAASPIRSRA